MNELTVRDLGRMGYEAAFAEQRRVHAEVVGGGGYVLLLVEHEPVVTISKRPGAREHLLAGEAMLARQGVAVCQTDRGGDITYHGPGQIVAYPIIDLRRRKLNLRQYVWLLEQAVIETAGRFGIEAHRDACAVGVWVGGLSDVGCGMSDVKTQAAPRKTQGANRTAPSAKIAAIGVRASRWVTMHGLALNVRTNLSHFGLIVPCGLAGRPVTSMERELGERCPTMDQVKRVLAERLTERLREGAAGAPDTLPDR
ncbi:MAG: lipoyl(octanoyl) transferase LipB [Phycisphaerales bacterium]